MIDLDAIRQAHPLPEVVGAVVDLKRAGNELRACCPFHEDRSPSFYLFDGCQRFHCFGCGANGDVLDFIGKLHRVSLPEAADMLTGGNVPVVHVAVPKANDRGDRTDEARRIWLNAGSIAGTPAERYLRLRGITIDLPDCLRFARLKLGRRGPMPALVALVMVGITPCGVQRIYLRDDGRKADLPNGKVKFSLGRVSGGAVCLSPDAADGMILSGSVEDGLSLLQMVSRPVWSAPGEGMVGNVRIPDSVQSVVIGVDADDAGRELGRRAADAHAGRGRRVRLIYPAFPAKDFNEELQRGTK